MRRIVIDTASIRDEVRAGQGRLPPDRIAQLLATTRCSADDLLLRLVEVAADFAVAGVSGYRVGAVAMGVSGALYLGANLELADLPLAHTVHAEQSVVAIALVHGETRVTKLGLSAPPCGHCRQFLIELDQARQLDVLIGGQPRTKLAHLLPEAFGPDQLKAGGDLLAHTHHDYRYASSDGLVQAAVTAAARAYAPYSHSTAGLALRVDGGAVIQGSAIESVAFNPSLAPLGAALSHLNLSGYNLHAIGEAVLVERASSPVHYGPTTQWVLRRIAPRAELKCLTC